MPKEPGKISERQRRILDFCISYMEEYGFPPSFREIGKAVGLASSSSVYTYIHDLIKAGYIEMPFGSSPRAIKVLGMRYVRDISVFPYAKR